MKSRFDPQHPEDLRAQAALQRKLAAVTRRPEMKAQLEALAAEYEETARILEDDQQRP